MSYDRKMSGSVKDACEAGHTFSPVYLATGEPMGFRITVRGPRSKAVREHANRKYAEAQAREAATRKRGREAEPLTLEDLDESLTELAIVYTIGWADVVDGGVDLPFSAEYARAWYGDDTDLRQQVIEQAQDLGKFIRPWSKSSSSTPAPNSAST